MNNAGKQIESRWMLNELWCSLSNEMRYELWHDMESDVLCDPEYNLTTGVLVDWLWDEIMDYYND